MRLKKEQYAAITTVMDMAVVSGLLDNLLDAAEDLNDGEFSNFKESLAAVESDFQKDYLVALPKYTEARDV